MNRKRFQPTKDMIIALLATTTIFATTFMVSENNEVKLKEGEIIKLEQKISENDKELKMRDEILDKYRRGLDKLEADMSEKDKVIEEQQKTINQKDAKIKELQNKELPTQVVSRGSARSGTEVTLTLTFYGDFAHENGGYAGIDAQGNKLIAGTVASNVHPFGTQFIINGQIFTVRDRGGKNFNSSNRLDVFVPRMKGESDAQYAKRISNYGIKKVTAQKI